LLEDAQSSADAATAAATAATAANAGEWQRRVDTATAEADAAKREAGAATVRAEQLAAQLERARGDTTTVTARLTSLEMMLASREAQTASTGAAARDAEGRVAGLVAAMEELSRDKEEAIARLTVLSAEVSILRGRVSEMEAREQEWQEADAQARALAQRVSELEVALSSARAEATAAEERVVQVREALRVDLEAAHATTARVTTELTRIAKGRDDQLAAAQEAAAASNAAAATLREQLAEAQDATRHQSERCRALQAQLAATAAEAQQHRDVGRQWHTEAMQVSGAMHGRGRNCGCLAALTPHRHTHLNARVCMRQARKDMQVEVERLAALNRALTHQLETVKADFGSFLGLLGESDTHPMPDAVLGVTPPLERYRRVLKGSTVGSAAGADGGSVGHAPTVTRAAITASVRRTSMSGSVVDAIMGPPAPLPTLSSSLGLSGWVPATTTTPFGASAARHVPSARPAPIPLAASRGPPSLPVPTVGGDSGLSASSGGHGGGTLPAVTPVRLYGIGSTSTGYAARSAVPAAAPSSLTHHAHATSGGASGLDTAGFAALRDRIAALDGSIRAVPAPAPAGNVGAGGGGGGGSA